MSRFIKYASNLLDGVDNIAKGSLTDQDVAAAAAAERRRRRKQVKLQEWQGQGSGDISEGLSESDCGDGLPLAAAHRRRSKESVALRYLSEDDVHAERVEDVVRGGTERAIGLTTTANRQGVAGRARLSTDPIVQSGEEDEKLKQGEPGGFLDVPTDLSSTDAIPVEHDDARIRVSSPLSSVEGREATSETVSQDKHGQDSTAIDEGSIRGAPEAPRRSTIGTPAGGTSKGERAPVAPTSDGEETSSAGKAVGDRLLDPEQTTDPSTEGTGPMTSNGPMENIQRGTPLGVMSTMNTKGTPMTLSLQNPTPAEDHAVAHALEDAAPGPPANLSPSRASEHHYTKAEPGGESSGGWGAQEGVGSGDGSSAARTPWTATSSGGNGRRGLGTLLGRGVIGRGGGGQGTDALKAEAAALRAEVEELSLELEDAEDRLKGQEAELRAAAEALKKKKATALEREGVMSAEMENFRALQAEEKRVFLANLEAMERSLADKERQMEEARTAQSSMEAFAMEREDTATRLMKEKDELLEELKGARTVQDRSAEELREALTRAETEAEEARERHRTWMRQAQARQVELEATAAQLTEALAEANRKSSGSGEEGFQRGAQVALDARKALASARELRAYQEELESCQASLELEQERSRALEQEVKGLRQDLDTARATEAVAERQRQEHANMAADSLAKLSRVEKQLEQERANAKRLGASMLLADPASQIQALSTKLLDKQARLDESVCERATLSAKLQQVTERAIRAEQELREARGEGLEAGTRHGGRLRRRAERLVGGARMSHAGSWSRLPSIAKHKKIVSAVDALDRTTLQAARAVFLGYLVLLHFWVFLVLVFRPHESGVESKPALALPVR